MSDPQRTRPVGVAREKVKENIWRRRSAKGRWVYEITFRDSDGRQRRQVVPGGLREAEMALASVKSRIGRGERVAPNPRLTFEQASQLWLDAKAPNLTAKTVRMYRYALDAHLLPAFGRWRLDRLDVTAVARFVAQMNTAGYRREIETRNGAVPTATTGYSAATIKAVLVPLSRTVGYARRHLAFAGENPVAALELDERPGYKQHRPKRPRLGRDELDRLIAAATSPYREIIAAAAALGTRMGETLGLTWAGVDFGAGIVAITQQANDKRELAKLKTETSQRRIEAPDWLMAMLAGVKLASPFNAPDDLVFPTGTGRPHSHGNVLTRGLYPALDAAGLPRTSFHSLRHTHASLWIKDGGDVITLSKRLGHATPQVTMTVYADDIEEANDGAVRKARVNALFAGTGMAALLRATDRGAAQTMAAVSGGAVLSLGELRH